MTIMAMMPPVKWESELAMCHSYHGEPSHGRRSLWGDLNPLDSQAG
jgi:hypothetical protein